MTTQELFKLADECKKNEEDKRLFSLEADAEAMLNEEKLKQLHQILGGTGEYRKNQLKIEPIGITPPEASELNRLMGHFISQLQISKKMFHPIEYAAICHKRILELYPFEDKNEEVAFLVLNLLLKQAGYEAISISEVERIRYIELLRAAQHPSHPNIDGFITFIAQCVVKALKSL